MVQKANRRWLRRLSEMQPYEIAWVPFGANHRKFAVVKEDARMALPKGLTVEAIEKAHAALTELLTVCKASDVASLTEAASKVIVEKLDSIADLILPPSEWAQPAATVALDANGEVADSGITGNPPASSTYELRSLLTNIRKNLEQLSVVASAADFTLGDQVDSILEETRKAEGMAPAEAPAAPAAPAVEVAKIEEPAAVAPAPLEAKATEPVAPVIAPVEAPVEAAKAAPCAEDEDEKVKKAAEPAAAAPVVATAPTTPEPAVAPVLAIATEPVAAPAPAPAPAPAMLSRADVESIVKSSFESLSKDFKEMITTVQKSMTAPSSGMPPMTPASPPAVSVRPAPPPREQHMNPMEFMDLTKSPDLDLIDEYGMPKS